MTESDKSSVSKTEFQIREASRDDIPELEELVEHFVTANRLLPRTTDELCDLIPFGFVAVIDDGIVDLRLLKFIPQSSLRFAASQSTNNIREKASAVVLCSAVSNWPCTATFWK
jgi:hypothetical protein